MKMSLTAPQTVAVREHVSFDPTVRYTFTSDVKHKWLVKAAWRLLEKLGAVREDEHKVSVKTYTYSKIHADKVSEYLIKSIHELADVIYKHDDYVVLMGQKTFDETIMEFDEDLRYWGSREVGGVVSGKMGYNNFVINGLRVVIAPMAEGCMVVPRAALERRP